MYIWRGRNRRDRRENKLSGLFGWGADKTSKSTQQFDDILRQEQEEVHTGYFRDRVRIVIHQYLGTENGKLEIKQMVNHLNEVAKEKAIKEARAAALSSGQKFDATKVKTVNDAVTKRHNIYEVFRKFDADGGGTLDPDELRVLLDELKVPMTDEELGALFEELDEDGEGGIDFDEFYTWFIAEAEKQKQKDLLTYYTNKLTGGVFDGFAQLVMEVEARNLCMDHAVWTATKDARIEFRIAHPPRFLCDNPHCGESFPTQEAFFAHQSDTKTHEEKDREAVELHERFRTVELFLASPNGRMVVANRLLFSTELASLQVRIRSVENTPFRPRTLDPDNKREGQLLKGMLVQGFDPKQGVRAGYKRRGMRTQHLCPGRTAEQPVLQDVISKLMYVRDDTAIDIVSAPSTSAHAEVVFTWKGFAKKTLEIIGSFNGWKKEPLNPYLQIAPPPQPYTTVQDDANQSKEHGKHGQDFEMTKSLTFGLSSIIKLLGPGRYHYRYVIDGEEKLDDKASKAVDPITGILSNIILVINPVVKVSEKNKRITALERMFPDTHNNSRDCDDAVSVLSNFSAQKNVKPKPKGKYDDVIHVQNLHTEEARALRNQELEGMIKVNLRNMCLYDDGAWAFASFMQTNHAIQELDISFNSISDEGMQAIATILPLMSVLHTFKANGNTFGFDGMRYILGPLIASKTLMRLELSGNKLCDDGAELIGEKLLPVNLTLKELYIDNNSIGNDGIEHIAAGLLRNKVLETLSVSNNLIYNHGAQRLAFAVQSSGSLKYLRVSNCPLGPAGARSFGEMLLLNDALTYLDLSRVDMMRNRDGSGIEAIVSGITTNRVLKQLVLRYNGLGDMITIDIIQALTTNFELEHVDVTGNNINAKFFMKDHYFATKISRETPSLTTRLELNAKIRQDPNAKRFKGKEREMDAEDDGRWTWRRKWKKVDRKAEQRRVLALSGSNEASLIEVEKEYLAEQIEKNEVSISAFLDNPNCRIFVTTTAKLIVQHMYDLLLLQPEPPPRDYAKEEAERLEAALKKIEEDRERRKSQKATSWQRTSSSATAATTASAVSATEASATDEDADLDIVEEQKNSTDSAVKGPSGDGRDLLGSSSKAGQPIPWDDERFNHVHVTVCAAIFINLGADRISLHLPFTLTEQAFQMLALPIHRNDLQAAVYELQLPNQPLISFKKFLQYTKTHAKRIVSGNYFARIRIQADLYFRPPFEEARTIILESFRYVAANDIRKNYRAQLETPPKFVCKICQRRFSSLKSLEKHVSKGDGSLDHRRLEMLAEIDEDRRFFLRRAKWLVTNTFFPSFYELVPDKNLLEDYIPQVFDSMGEEGRPLGVVEPKRTLLVEDVLGDFMQIAFEGRLGWVRYQLPQEKERFRHVLRVACEDVPHFSWKNLRVFSNPIYYQVRDDKELPKNFELKVRAEPYLESPVIGYIKMGQVVESRASINDWLHIKFENFDCAWVVKVVGGGHHRPPLTRSELKEKARQEAEKLRLKVEKRLERLREMKAAAAKRRNKGKQPLVLKIVEDEEPPPVPGTQGAETLRMLHDQVQKRLRQIVVMSPYNPTSEDLEVVEELPEEEKADVAEPGMPANSSVENESAEAEPDDASGVIGTT